MGPGSRSLTLACPGRRLFIFAGVVRYNIAHAGEIDARLSHSSSLT
jgi:hypothetical protein